MRNAVRRDDGSADAAVVGPCAYRDIWRGLTDAFPAPLRAADDIRWWSVGGDSRPIDEGVHQRRQ